MQWLSRLSGGAKPGSGPKWLDGYKGQTAAQLIALETSYRLDSLVLAFEQALGTKAAKRVRRTP